MGGKKSEYLFPKKYKRFKSTHYLIYFTVSNNYLTREEVKNWKPYNILDIPMSLWLSICRKKPTLWKVSRKPTNIDYIFKSLNLNIGPNSKPRGNLHAFARHGQMTILCNRLACPWLIHNRRDKVITATVGIQAPEIINEFRSRKSLIVTINMI